MCCDVGLEANDQVEGRLSPGRQRRGTAFMGWKVRGAWLYS